MSWDEVSEIHRSQRGIYQQKGKLISLLTDFGQLNPCYPDRQNHSAEKIYYTGAGRRGDQKLDVWNQAIINSIKSGIKVPLFCKLAVGKWKYMGLWQIIEANYIFDQENKRMVWKFTLENNYHQL